MRLVIFGAAGPTGLLLVNQSLMRGHTVTAVSRRPEEFPLRDAELTVVGADATDADAVTRVIEGADAVASVLGTKYSKEPITVYSSSARAITAAMQQHGMQRLVVTSSSAAAPWPDPSWSWVERNVVHRVLNKLGATLYADMRRMEQMVMASNLEWTVMRPLGLANIEPPTEYAVAVDRISGKQTARCDLASAILDEIDDTSALPAHPRQCVAVATTNKTVSLPATIWREGIKPQLIRADGTRLPPLLETTTQTTTPTSTRNAGGTQ